MAGPRFSLPPPIAVGYSEVASSSGPAGHAMVVGVCRLELLLPGNASLKGKRSVVRRIVDRTSHRFNVAVAEVDRLDAHERAVLGFAVVSNEGRHAQSMVDRIVSFVSEVTEARIVDRHVELVHMGEEHNVEGDWAAYDGREGDGGGHDG